MSGDKYADFHMIDDETHRTRLAVLMPMAEAVKLATAILERAPATRDDHELDRS